MTFRKNLTGKKFGRLTVLYYDEMKGNPTRAWRVCKCICGKEVSVSGSRLSNGNTQSCGCYHLDRTKEGSITHGETKTSLYNIRLSIRQRCKNKNCKSYKNYGGRGIKYTKDWDKYENFKKDMGETYKEGLTIDRIDNNGNYSKDNCIWSTYEEQANNKRNNALVEWNGKKQTLSMWSRELGIKRSTLSMRYYKYNWDVERLLTTKI